MAAGYRKGKFSVKRVRYIIAMVISIMLLGSVGVQASNISIDTKDAKEGIVRVSYTGVNKKIKVMVEKDSSTYYYDLKSDEESFPLQLGQGRYTVAVLENISGNKYKVLTKKGFKADIKEKNAVFLKSAQPVLWDENMEVIRFAEELTAEAEDDESTVQAIYDYIVSYIRYDYDKLSRLSSDYIPDIDEIFEDKSGICYDYSALFAGMLRSRGIPTKLVKGYKNDIKGYHAWNEAYINGKWEIIDTTYDSYMRINRTGYQMYKEKKEYKKSKEY